MSDDQEINIKIQFPAEDAETFERFAKELVNEAQARAHQKKRDEQIKVAERKRYADRKAAFFALAPEAYRLYQLHRPDHQSANTVYSIIAGQLHLDTPIAAELLVQKHRYFLRLEREKKALKLARKGLTNKAIGEQLGVSTRTAIRILKVARAKKAGGRNA